MSGFALFLAFLGILSVTFSLRGVNWVEEDEGDFEWATGESYAENGMTQGSMKVTRPIHFGVWVGIGILLMLIGVLLLFHIIP